MGYIPRHQAHHELPQANADDAMKQKPAGDWWTVNQGGTAKRGEASRNGLW